MEELRQNKKGPKDKTIKEDELPVGVFYFLNISLIGAEIDDIFTAFLWGCIAF